MDARAALAFIRRHGIVFKCAAERFLQSHSGIVDQQSVMCLSHPDCSPFTIRR
jgi:hypothetical protein